MLDQLPPDLVHDIFDVLDLRSIVCAASTCTHLLQCARTRTLQGSFGRMMPASTIAFVYSWAPNFMKLRSKHRGLSTSIPTFLGRFTHLKHLHLSMARVPDWVIEHLPLTLESLYVRKLKPSLGATRHLHTKRFDRLNGSLKHLSLWLSGDYMQLVVDHTLTALSTLNLEAPTLTEVVGIPPAPSRLLHLNTLELITDFGQIAMAPCTRVSVSEFAIPREAFDKASLPNVRFLTYKCPVRHWIPSLSRMTNLERLSTHLDLTIVLPEDFCSLPKLRWLKMRNRYGFAVSDRLRFRGFDRNLVECHVYMGGVRLDVGTMLYAPL